MTIHILSKSYGTKNIFFQSIYLEVASENITIEIPN
jgi:hypothetical protein